MEQPLTSLSTSDYIGGVLLGGDADQGAWDLKVLGLALALQHPSGSWLDLVTTHTTGGSLVMCLGLHLGPCLHTGPDGRLAALSMIGGLEEQPTKEGRPSSVPTGWSREAI